MTVLFDGIASGVLLFLISVGLSVTLGLMNFVNLAHGAFAMLGGYICVTLLNRFGVPFLVHQSIELLDKSLHFKLIRSAFTEIERALSKFDVIVTSKVARLLRGIGR